ncbi:hypothetical protein FMEAI12_3350029 [Parafrankia sp. Ea1.12]|nr:hypothetical protein FMEAI12_3350029 [Parafrankia sp. Ea1.12]
MSPSTSVMDGLDVVAVEIAEEHRVVAGVILRPLAWRVKHLDARAERGLVDGVDGLPVSRMERQVQLPCLGTRRRAEPEGGHPVRTGEPDDGGPLERDAHRLAHPERGEHREIEGEGGLDVTDLDTNVIKHGHTVATAYDSFGPRAAAGRGWPGQGRSTRDPGTGRGKPAKMPCTADDASTACCHSGRVVNERSGQAPLVELADELARIYAEPAVACQLLERAGLDRSRHPRWSNTPREFWYEAGRLLTDGATVNGWDRLLAEALDDYPGNGVLRSAAAATEPPRYIRPGTQPPAPGEGAGAETAPGADDVVTNSPPPHRPLGPLKPPGSRRPRRSRGRGGVVGLLAVVGVVVVVLVAEVAFGGDNPDTVGSAAGKKRCALVRKPVSDVFDSAGGQGHVKVKYTGDRVVLVELPQRVQDGVRWAAVALPSRGDSRTGVGWMHADDLTSTPCEGPPAPHGADSPPLPRG